jgi:hypothetical protein
VASQSAHFPSTTFVPSLGIPSGCSRPAAGTLKFMEVE